MLRDPFAQLGDTPAVSIMTSNKPTEVSIVRTTAGMSRAHTEDMKGGDSLVPYQQTLDSGGASMLPHVRHFPGNVRAHAFLGIDEEIVLFIESFLSS